jgi:hypothetical protein
MTYRIKLRPTLSVGAGKGNGRNTDTRTGVRKYRGQARLNEIATAAVMVIA